MLLPLLRPMLFLSFLAPFAGAQQGSTTGLTGAFAGGLQPVTAPVRDAGVLHLATGLWTRHPSVAALGADVIFNNTCPTGYYFPLDPAWVCTDDGRLPSTTSPDNGAARPGCATQYAVSGVQIAYCTDQPSLDVQLDFYEHLVFCQGTAGITPTASLTIPTLPGSSSGGQACWTVTIDLEAGGGGQVFTMLADGDGSYDGATWYFDKFGWSFRTPSVVGNNSGPIVAGANTCGSGYLGTRWSPTVDYAQPGLGLGDGPDLMVEDGSGLHPCFTAETGMHLRLFSDACGDLTGQSFCYGDGSGTPCPCGSSSPPSVHEGCPNSVNGLNGALLEAVGVASLQNDTASLSFWRAPASAPALFFQGTQRQNGGLGSLLGDGLRCAGGSVMRLAMRTSDSQGHAQFPAAGDPRLSVVGGIGSPGIRTYQVWYRNAASFCTPATYNLTNGWEIAWGP